MGELNFGTVKLFRQAQYRAASWLADGPREFLRYRPGLRNCVSRVDNAYAK